MIFFVILIALFSWFVLFMKSKIHLFEPFANVNTMLANSTHFTNYIKNVHPYMYSSKIKNYTPNTTSNVANRDKFFREYMGHLRLPRHSESGLLNKYVIICNKILMDNKLHYVTKVPWVFIVSKKGLEMGMPYTLSNYIVINETTLAKLTRVDKIDQTFVNTLIHEKIHVIQRLNQAKFNRFYTKTFTFIGKKIQIEDVPLQYAKIFMSNPDSNEDFWLYRINNSLYYPILVKDGDYVKSIAINSTHSLDLSKFKSKLGYKSHISFYHPNEIFACQVADMILEMKIPSSYSKLLNNL